MELKILEMEKLSSIWNCRNLTLVGKITIIKTLLISKIIHILLSLPKPSEEYFIRMENVFKKFLWQDKPPKFKLSILENLIANGGLQFPNIRKIDMTMKASWIKRLYRSDDGWAATPLHYGLGKVYDYGDVFLQRKNTIRNVFWRDVISSVYSVYSNANIKNLEHLLTTPIWYNSKMISEKLQTWVDKGIMTVGDLLDNDGLIVSLDYINNNLQLNCNFLFYDRLKKKIKLLLGNSQILEHNNLRPRLPYILYIVESCTKGNKNIYFNSLPAVSNIMVDLQNKWSEKLNDEIRLDTISNSFKNAKKYSPSVYQHFIQYKLLHRRVVHNHLLYRMNISETPNCLFCNAQETIEHVYIECPNVIRLWQDTENWVKTLNFPHFKISDTEKIFGEKFNDHLKHLIITSIKDVIYQKRKHGNTMLLFDVKRTIVKNLHILKTQELLKKKVSNFDNDWRVLIDNFRIDSATRNSWYLI